MLPLTGITVVEFAGLAPGPFAGQVLSDWGANVIRVDQADRGASVSVDILVRGKRALAVNLKTPSGLQLVTKLLQLADVLIDPFRPGVLEKLGLGPEVFLSDGGLNKRLVYARLVGFSPTGPHKDMAGHDINYLALSGVLSMLPGSPEKPSFPINVLADFAGGGLTCALGIMLALFERTKSNQGQIVNTDMVSGARYVSSFPIIGSYVKSRAFAGPRGTNLLDGGAPFYDVYTCSDGRWMTVGCLEPQFFKEFITRFTNALPPSFSPEWKPNSETQFITDDWPKFRAYLTNGFKKHTRDYWADVFHGTDACALPVLSPSEAANLYNGPIPTPHPHLSRTHPDSLQSPSLESLKLGPGEHTEEILRELGVEPAERNRLIDEGALGRTAQKAKL